MADDPQSIATEDPAGAKFGGYMRAGAFTQEEANYQAIGGTSERACGNCRWFSSPDFCTIVEPWPEPINSNGLSDKWEAKSPPDAVEPVQVVIVKDNEDGDKAETKREGGVDFPPADFAVVPDTELPSGWKLRLAESRPGNVTVAQVGRAITAMQPSGFRGNRVQLSSSEKTGAIRKISGAIGRISGASDEQKSNLRERLDAVKEVRLIADIPSVLLDKAKTYLRALKVIPEEPSPSMVFYKDANDAIRWVAWASNRWRDNDNPPEIISEKAHQDFVQYIDDGGAYPEAWLWHTPGTKWGQADFVDYMDGFLIVSGTVIPGMEHVAESLANEKDLGISHGYKYGHYDPDGGIIGWYRSFEVSPLPLKVAANKWTAIDVLTKEVEMGFSDTKRAWLVGHLGEEDVSRLEGDTAAAKAALEKKGIDYKDMPEDEPKPVSEPTVPVLNQKALGDLGAAAAKALVETDAFKGLVTSVAETSNQAKETNGQIKGITDRLDHLERTDDAKIADAVRGQDHRPPGHVASEDDKSVIADADGNAIPAAKVADADFFQDVVMDGLVTTP